MHDVMRKAVEAGWDAVKLRSCATPPNSPHWKKVTHVVMADKGDILTALRARLAEIMEG